MISYNDPISSFSNYKSISVITSRDCTLRCEYCYLHKHPDNKYEIDKVLESVDKLLDYYHNKSNSSLQDGSGVVLDFYPEPWVNIPRTNKLIEECLKLLYKYPKFYGKYMISMGTNGLLLDKPIPILDKILNNLSISVTVDGIKEQHDMYRVTPNGSGSWDKVVSNVKRFKNKFNINGTKVTIGPSTIKYIFESTKYLWFDLGLDSIAMNVVFENLWGNESEKKKYLEEFEEQLQLLTNFIIKNKLWEKNKYTSIVGDRIIPRADPINIEILKSKNEFLPDTEAFYNTPYCGAAVMRSVDVDGEIYPCFRLSPYSLNQNSPYNINKNKFIEGPMRALHAINGYDCSDYECLDCNLLSTCHMCFGGAWEETQSVYYRTKHHCEFHKLQHKYACILKTEMNKEIKNV